MIKDKDTCHKIIEAILFASTDLVDEKDLKTKLPKGINVKKILLDLKSIYKSRGINIYNVKNKYPAAAAVGFVYTFYIVTKDNIKGKYPVAG